MLHVVARHPAHRTPREIGCILPGNRGRQARGGRRVYGRRLRGCGSAGSVAADLGVREVLAQPIGVGDQHGQTGPGADASAVRGDAGLVGRSHRLGEGG